MPAAKTKKTKTPESVPGEGDPDRKRVLNVLAQRRYRQRRRERIAALEAQAKVTSPSQISRTASEEEEDENSLVEPELRKAVTERSFSNKSTVSNETDVQSSSTNYVSLFDLDQEPFELNFTQDYNFPNLPTPLQLTPVSTPAQFPLTPDASLLRIPILDALHAFAHVSIAFNVATHVWNPSYLHVVPRYIPAVAALPTNLHPVPAQLTIPHHPMLDLLPWPSVREKLICMFSMPSTLRPPVAQEDDGDDDCSTADLTSHDSALPGGHVKQSKAIIRLMYDLEGVQGGEGLRVHGNMTTWGEGNELREDAWEIGDEFYRKWWWCLDQRIVELANRKRRERGLPRLKMGT